MDKKELIKYIEQINLTGPGGRDKIKKVLIELATNWGEGGGGDDPTPPTPSGLDKYVYYGGSDTEVPIDSNTENVIGSLGKSKNRTISNVPCYTKYYYISLPLAYQLQKVVTENNENITNMFSVKGAYSQDGDSYILREFHLSSDMPLDVNITITING